MSEPITDEVLAAWERGLVPDTYASANVAVVRRLIAALRTARQDLRIANEATLVLMERAVKAEAEVERLRALEMRA